MYGGDPDGGDCPRSRDRDLGVVGHCRQHGRLSRRLREVTAMVVARGLFNLMYDLDERAAPKVRASSLPAALPVSSS